MQNVFKRNEQKYILSNKEYNDIQIIINKYFNKDMYFDNKIYNIYFDNNNRDMIINSLEKSIYKKKIRVRSYGIPNDDSFIYFEIKEKYKGIVYKRRVKLSLMEYNNYINNEIIPNHDKQIMKEIDYIIKYYNLKPYIFLAYDRLSYYSKDDINFRVTFDSNLRSRYDNLKFKDNNDKLYFKDNKYIMEVKSINNLPTWFVSYLSKNKIYPVSFSKIGNIYKERGDVKC